MTLCRSVICCHCRMLIMRTNSRIAALRTSRASISSVDSGFASAANQKVFPALYLDPFLVARTVNAASASGTSRAASAVDQRQRRAEQSARSVPVHVPSVRTFGKLRKGWTVRLSTRTRPLSSRSSSTSSPDDDEEDSSFVAFGGARLPRCIAHALGPPPQQVRQRK